MTATVVLVHGAWGGSWMWEGVIDDLATRNVKALAVDLPTCAATDTSVDLHDDAQHVRSVIDDAGGPVVLVGNSYGGVVITEAGAGHPDVKRLVYIASAMPDEGEPVLTVLNESSSPDFNDGVQIRDDGLLTLDPEVAVRCAFQQSSSDVHGRWRELGTRPMSYGADFNMEVRAAAWKTVPSTYIVCADDRSIRPEAQREWAKARATDVLEWPTDHCPQLSHPGKVSELLAGLAGQAG